MRILRLGTLLAIVSLLAGLLAIYKDREYMPQMACSIIGVFREIDYCRSPHMPSQSMSRDQAVAFLKSYHIAARGKPEELLQYYSPSMQAQVLRVRRDVNRIWPIRSYEVLTDTVEVRDDGPDRFLVRYRVRMVTRNKAKSRDRISLNEATLSNSK